jgi:hypothetical protein
MSTAQVQSATQTFAVGDERTLLMDTNGNLKVNVVTGGGGGSSTVTLAAGTANVGTVALSTGGTVALTGALPAGTNNVGTFALSTGGTVSITGTPTVTSAAGTATIGFVGQKTTVPTALSIGTVTTAGTAVAAATGPWQGGIVRNPYSGTGTLYVNLVSTAGTVETGSTLALLPGDSRNLPPVSSGVTLSVNASASSYVFAGEIDV